MEKQCPFCGHRFVPGEVVGNIYCARCGGRFHPNAAMQETVALLSATERGEPSADGDGDDKAETAKGASPRLALSVSDRGTSSSVLARAASVANGKHKASFSASGASRSVGGARRLPTGEQSAEEAEQGERFGDYDLIEEIARGGMGVVYRAYERSLKRIVALKLLRSGDDASPEERERLLREASSAAGLSHPNIVPVHEFSVFQGRPFFTMDLVEGSALDRVLERGPMAPIEACRLIETVARAIDYAHGRGIVHRDLKPANIIISPDGQPRVTDFGLAVRLGPDPDAERMTRVGSVMGTIPYIPPEQAAGRVNAIDARSDVYSLGAVLYECVTGRPPFTGDTQFELLRRVIHQEPEAPRKLHPRLHRDVETIIMTCLEKDPHRRYQTAAALADDCQAFLRGEVIHARPASWRLRVWRWIWRRRMPVALGMVLVLLAMTYLLVLRYRHAATTWRKVSEEEKAKSDSLEIAVAKSESQLFREWRDDVSIDFSGEVRYSTSPDEARRQGLLWVDPARVRLGAGTSIGLVAGPAREPARPALGLPLPYPHDFRLTALVTPPESGDAGLTVWVDVDRMFSAAGVATRIDLGDVALSGPPDALIRRPGPGSPGPGSGAPPTLTGLALIRNNTEVASNPEFAWKPGVPAELKIERLDGGWTITVDGVEMLRLPPTAAAERGEGYMALSASGAGMRIARLSVSTKGLSTAMVENTLEFARRLLSQGEFALALPLYERLAGENTDQTTHLRSLRGLARACGGVRGGDAAGAVAMAVELSEKRPPNARPKPGETAYVAGLAALSSSGSARVPLALDWFAAAALEGRSKSEALTYDTFRMVGPFVRPGTSRPLSETFQPEYGSEARAYAEPGRTLEWIDIGNAGEQAETLTCPPEGTAPDDAVYYVKRIFRAKERLAATLHVESGAPTRVWLNGIPAGGGDGGFGVDLAAAVELQPGDNVILLKIVPEKRTTFRMRLAVDGARHAGLYGQLALLERSLVRWRRGEDTLAAAELGQLASDGTLTSLKALRLAGAISQPIGALLELADERIRGLETPGDPPRGRQAGRLPPPPPPAETVAAARERLEAAGVLAAAAEALGGDPREVAQRYRLIALAWGRPGRFPGEGESRAEAAFSRAHFLAPDWVAPWVDQALLTAETRGGEAARVIWEQALAALPQSVELRLALARYWLEDYVDSPPEPMRALAASEEAIVLGGRAAAYESKARALKAMGRLDEAEQTAAAGLAMEERETLVLLRRELREAIATRALLSTIPIAEENLPVPTSDPGAAPMPAGLPLTPEAVKPVVLPPVPAAGAKP